MYLGTMFSIDYVLKIGWVVLWLYMLWEWLWTIILDGAHCLLFSFIMFIYYMEKLVLASQCCDGWVFTLLKQIPFYFRFLIKKLKKKKKIHFTSRQTNTVKYFLEHSLECKQTNTGKTNVFLEIICIWKYFMTENILQRNKQSKFT